MIGMSEAFREDCRRAGEINRGNLLNLLRENQGTEFGKAYGFAQIRDVDAYKRAVPLSDYRRFSPYIQSMRAGQTDVLTVYPVAAYCRTSGTEGAAKYIPVTKEALGRYTNGFQVYQDELYREVGGKRLFVNTFRTDLSRPVEPVLLYTEIYYRYLYEEGFLHTRDYAGGRTLLFQRDPGDSLYAKAWAAVLERNLTILESVFLYDMLIFFHYLESNWQGLLQDIRRRHIPEKCRLPGEVAKCLLSMETDEGRLRQVEQECRKGFQGIAKRLWKKLRLVSGIGAESFYEENQALQRYTEDTPHYYLGYCASECYMGMPVGEDDFRYVLLPRNAFYEFLPVKEEPSGEAPQGQQRLSEAYMQTYLPEEVEAGQSYEVAITNYSGLYRYRMGDVVKVAGFYGESPLLQFAYRRNQALNLAGEKMGIRQVEEAVQGLERLGICFQEYCFGISKGEVPGRYLLAATVDPRAGSVGEPQIEAWIDRALMQGNAEYEDLRRMGYIARPHVRLFTWWAYQELLEKNGLTKGHRKPKHIAPNGFQAEEFDALAGLKDTKQQNRNTGYHI